MAINTDALPHVETTPETKKSRLQTLRNVGMLASMKVASLHPSTLAGRLAERIQDGGSSKLRRVAATAVAFAGIAGVGYAAKEALGGSDGNHDAIALENYDTPADISDVDLVSAPSEATPDQVPKSAELDLDHKIKLGEGPVDFLTDVFDGDEEKARAAVLGVDSTHENAEQINELAEDLKKEFLEKPKDADFADAYKVEHSESNLKDDEIFGLNRTGELDDKNQDAIQRFSVEYDALTDGTSTPDASSPDPDASQQPEATSSAAPEGQQLSPIAAVAKLKDLFPGAEDAFTGSGDNLKLNVDGAEPIEVNLKELASFLSENPDASRDEIRDHFLDSVNSALKERGDNTAVTLTDSGFELRDTADTPDNTARNVAVGVSGAVLAGVAGTGAGVALKRGAARKRQRELETIREYQAGFIEVLKGMGVSLDDQAKGAVRKTITSFVESVSKRKINDRCDGISEAVRDMFSYLGRTRGIQNTEKLAIGAKLLDLLDITEALKTEGRLVLESLADGSYKDSDQAREFRAREYAGEDLERNAFLAAHILNEMHDNERRGANVWAGIQEGDPIDLRPDTLEAPRPAPAPVPSRSRRLLRSLRRRLPSGPGGPTRS